MTSNSTQSADVPTNGGRRSPSARGELRRQSIMDAAEAVFAERGYYGSSLREVSARAGAAIGLIAHYFPTKEELFRAVVDRKLGRLTAIVESSIAESIAAGGEGERDLIRAFLAPFLIACARHDDEIRSYIRLTSHFMSAYTVPELRPALESLLPVSTLFSERLRRLVPDLAEEDFIVAIYLIEAALVFMTQDNGFLQALSGGALQMEDIDKLIDPAATFFAGGLAALKSPSR
jgi:AcrR family transcriptional regulator